MSKLHILTTHARMTLMLDMLAYAGLSVDTPSDVRYVIHMATVPMPMDTQTSVYPLCCATWCASMPCGDGRAVHAVKRARYSGRMRSGT